MVRRFFCGRLSDCFNLAMERLAGRAVKHFSELAQDNQIVVLPIEPPRGKILDRHGEVLADNSTAYRLEVASDFAANVMEKWTP